ncbi:MAG: DUF4824 family protein [Acidobacteria bacterium]|nr:DUF4824 family protein [Acidobacteriota bacterium]
MKPRRLSFAAAALAVIIPLAVTWRANANRQATTSSIVLTERELMLNTGDRNQSAIYLTFLMSNLPDATLSGRAQELGLARENQKPRRGFAVFELREPGSPSPSATPASQLRRRPNAGPVPTPPRPDVSNLASRLTPVDAGLDPHRLRQQWPQPDRYLIAPAQLSAHQVTGTKPSDSYWQLHIHFINGRLQVPAEWRGFFLSLPKIEAGAKPLVYRVHIRFGANYEPWLESAWVPTEPVSNPARPPLSQEKAH